MTEEIGFDGVDMSTDRNVRTTAVMVAVESMKHGTASNDVSDSTTKQLLQRAVAIEEYIESGMIG